MIIQRPETEDVPMLYQVTDVTWLLADSLIDVIVSLRAIGKTSNLEAVL